MKYKNLNKVYVLHEYGAQNHYKGLVELCDNKNIEVEFYEFRFFYQILKSLYRKDFNLFKRSLRNMVFIANLIFTFKGGAHIVVGIAPYDWRMVIINYITKRHEVYLHTSWPFWNSGYQPKESNCDFVQKSWSNFISRANKIFAVTYSVKKGILDKYENLTCDDIDVVYHSIDLEFYNSARDNTKFDYSQVDKVVYIGRFEESKGLSDIEYLAKKLKYRNIKFYFIGSGNYKFEQIDNCEVIGNIKSREELATIISSSSVLLLPSHKTEDWQELFGMVIIEAMCCGVFPITTNHLGPSEVLESFDGALIDQNNIRIDMEIKLDLYFSKSSEEKTKLSKDLVVYAKKFNVESISKRWEKVFYV